MVSKKDKVRLFFWGFVLILVLAATIFYNHLTRLSEGDVAMDSQNIFASQDFDFTFQYPKQGWSPRTSRGRTEKYDAVYLQGPVNAQMNFAVLIEIVAKPLTTGKTATILAEDFLKHRTDWPKFKIVQKRTLEIDKAKAFFAIYESEAFLPIESLHSAPTMIREHVVFLTRGSKSYRISFHTLASEQDNYEPVFRDVLRTLHFKT